MKYFLVAGSHPFLSWAEAKAVIGGRKPEIAGDLAIFDAPDWEGDVLQKRLAGTVKLGEVVLDMDAKDFRVEMLADQLEARPRANKILFGLTLFGGSSAAREKTKALPLQLKRLLQERGRSVRWFAGERGDVSPAAVAKAGLIDQGFDICIGFFGSRIVIGFTTHVQDADAWSLRDYGRPFRDTEVGMLPPKLARLMVNLATGKNLDVTLLDPFCGGGTVAMEAALMGCSSLVMSDIDARQVEGCRRNFDWMVEQGMLEQKAVGGMKLLVQSVQTLPNKMTGMVDAIVTEGYLGRPLSGHETLPTLQKQKQEIDQLWRETLAACMKMQRSGGRLVCSWSVFCSSHGTVAVDIKDEVEDFGYRLIDPLADWHEKSVTLTYARQNQRVKRNILVLERM